MIIDFLKGARYAITGFSLIKTPGIRRYVILPLLINIVLFIGGIYFAFGEANVFVDWLLEKLPDWLAWLSWLLWLLFIVLAAIIVFYTFTLVANLVGSPFNGLLAEKLEQQLTGAPPPSGGRFIETLRGIQNAILSELRKFAYLIGCIVPLLLVSIIPVVNVISPLLWFTFGAWMLALEYLDYPMGNHGFTFKEEREIARQKRGVVLGFGSAVVVMTMVPILNFFAMPVAVTGATKLWVDVFSGRRRP